MSSLKVKLGLLVVVSVTVAAGVATLGRSTGVPVWLSVPVTILLALAVTQLLALGMTSPLRQMTEATRRMATGDYAVRVTEGSSDEVGQLARAFNTMARDLAGVDRQRRDLVANVSHELRTPIAALCAVLDNAVDGVGPRDPASLQVALDQANRMGRLVEDLLDLARVDAGKAPLAPESFEIRPLVVSAVAEARAVGRRVGYDVRVQPPTLRVKADPARLHQLVTNLLDNASRHSPTGGTVLVTVARRRDEHADVVRLEIQDQGPGVAAEHREEVFEPFGTLSTTEGGGTGLGLAIARWVTTLHGGTIRFLDPTDGSRGARVRVELPLEPPARPARPTEPRPPRGPTQPTAALVSQPAPASLASHAGPVAGPGDTGSPAAHTVVARPVLDDLFGAFWPEHGVPARLAVLLGAVAAGIVGGVVLPFRDAGLGTFLVLVAAGGVVLAASRHRRDSFTLTCAALCVLLAGITVVRDADWILVLCLLAGAALCVSGVTRFRTVPGLLLSGLAWPLAGLRGLPWLGRTLARLTGIGQGAALLRTVVWSLLLLLVFGALFASADALVAEWVDTLLPDLTLDTFVLRAFVSVAVGGTVLAAAYLALNPPRVDREGRGPRPLARRFEWLAPVLVVNAVFAAFLVAQATVVFGGHDYLQRTTGLTYAEYVHQGFGQLTVATALTLLVIAAAGRKAPRATRSDRSWLRVALGLLCLQTLVVVGSALHRMELYQEAYGFTRLRLLVDVFEAWLGLLVVAVVISGIALRGRWLPRFAVLSGVVALLGLAAVNPDAWIAEHNLDRYAATGRVDWDYLRNLSADAVPTIAERAEDVRRCALLDREPAADDWLEWNLGRARATEVLEDLAPASALPPECAAPSD